MMSLSLFYLKTAIIFHHSIHGSLLGFNVFKTSTSIDIYFIIFRIMTFLLTFYVFDQSIFKENEMNFFLVSISFLYNYV